MAAFVTTLKSALAAATLSCLMVAMPASADEADTLARLTANGVGSVNVIPDIAIVTMGVLSRAKTASAALRANSADLGDVIEAVLDEGVNEIDIGTSGFSISPVYRRLRQDEIGEEPPAIVGYTVSNRLRVVIRDIAESGGLLDRVVRAGANQVNGITFDIDDREAAGDLALASAIADARRKAEIMADTAGVRLVRIIAINGNDNTGRPVFERAMAFSDVSVPVMPGERAITASASVTWEIAPR
ncbi:MAG: SIMPL domain-containing protein [Alphaproteobacteria bacterium]